MNKEDAVMKKILLVTAIAVTFSSSYVLAHHPAEAIVDEEIYDMISANVSDSHDQVLTDMGDMTGSVEPGDDVGSNSREAIDVEVGQSGAGPTNQD
jgi:hypothetical protein